MKTALSFTGVVGILSVGMAIAAHRVEAQDYSCFMQTASGQILNLSQALCGGSTGQNGTAPTTVTSPTIRMTPTTAQPTTNNFSSGASRSGSLPYRAGNGRPTISPFLAGKVYSCGSFKYLSEAQTILTYDPQNDPFYLDPDRDGIACEGSLAPDNGVGTPRF